MADNVDELFPEPQMAEEVIEEPAPVEQVEAEQPEPEPAPEPAPEPQAPREDEQRTIPLATALNWRDEAKEAKRRIAELEARNQPQMAPDPFDDPQGFAAHQTQQVEQRLMQERFAMSDMFARQAHGAETVDQAVTWAQERAAQDPAFATSYMRQQNPIEWIVQQHKRDALLSDIGDPSKLDDWFEREAVKRGWSKQSAPAPVVAGVTPQPASPPVRVPRSLAAQGTAPSDVRQTATGPLAGVDALFG